MRNGVFVSTYLGNRFYPLEPRIDDIEIGDIAHGLAYQCRFNGQTSSFYSVAQHSVLVASLVPKELQMAALLHDAAEAYLGDMVKPLKLLVPEFSQIEKRVMEIIGERFGVADLNHPLIKPCLSGCHRQPSGQKSCLAGRLFDASRDDRLRTKGSLGHP